MPLLPSQWQRKSSDFPLRMLGQMGSGLTSRTVSVAQSAAAAYMWAAFRVCCLFVAAPFLFNVRTSLGICSLDVIAYGLDHLKLFHVFRYVCCLIHLCI
jgi:hypothetical protein